MAALGGRLLIRLTGLIILAATVAGGAAILSEAQQQSSRELQCGAVLGKLYSETAVDSIDQQVANYLDSCHGQQISTEG